jgi:ATP-dependent helicase HrpB
LDSLPIYQVIPNIQSTLRHHNRVILQAPPGAGKTTAVPLALLDEPWLAGKKIVMLEPRRLATRSAASRMAELLGERVGERVGYQIKADRCMSNKTKILIVTEGILTRMLQHDNALESVALIIFDEFHERNLHGDLALALSLQSQELLRDDLKIMIMSATLHTKAISKLLDNAPIIISQGRSYDVENIYLNATTAHPTLPQLSGTISKILTQILAKEEGSILIFLPGVKEIKQLQAKLSKITEGKNITIAPLYGNLSKADQDRAIIPAKKGYRKIVLATNIAETSLTILGINTVIDSGLQRVSIFNSGSGMNQLQTIKISQDSATQRSGRAGRLSTGKCYRIWHKHLELMAHSTAEILTSDLTALVLELANWGVDEYRDLHWLDLPPDVAIRHSRDLLNDLGALKGTRITPHGNAMLEFGTHPRFAHMILKADELGYAYHATLLAALLSEKDIFTGAHKNDSDLLARITVLQEPHKELAYVDNAACRNVLKTAALLQKKLPTTKPKQTPSAELIGLLLAFAYPQRIAAQRAKKSNRYLLRSGKGAVIREDDTLFNEPYLVIADLNAKESNAHIYTAAPISKAVIEEYFSEFITKERLIKWNESAQRVEGSVITKLGAITLDEKPIHDIENEDISLALLGAVREQGIKALQLSSETQAVQDRIAFINYHQPNQLPDLSDAWLLNNLEIWLAPHLIGIKSFKAIAKINTHHIILGLLTWEEQRLLESLAPQKLKVPSGSNIRILYNNPESPTLCVRLQELFGMHETPRILNNTITLTIELLSPAYRPIQITKDLHSFWENTYDDVKKELRGKYKKHYWPDDPFTAQATNKTKKYM